MSIINTAEKMSSYVDGHFFCPQSHAFFPRVKKRREGRDNLTNILMKTPTFFGMAITFNSVSPKTQL